MQRSFRLPNEVILQLDQVAEHLAKLDGRAPNQTKALIWAIARAIDAIERQEKQARAIPEGIEGQIMHVARVMHGLAENWQEAARKAAWERGKQGYTVKVKSEEPVTHRHTVRYTSDVPDGGG